MGLTADHMARVAHAYYFGPGYMDVDGVVPAEVSDLVRYNLCLTLHYSADEAFSKRSNISLYSGRFTLRPILSGTRVC